MEELIKVIAIKKLKKVGMYQVETTDGEITVSDDIIVEFRLEKDKELTGKEFKELKKENDRRNIFYKVCNYISYGMRSEYEIYRYLDEHDIKKSDAHIIVDELKQAKMIDDNALAGYILDSIIRNKKGPKVFENKIFERKLKISIEDFPYSDEMQEEVLDEVILKLYDKKKELPIKKQKEQLYQKLIRDGFSSNLVFNKLNKVDFIDDSSETLKKDVNKLLKKYEKLTDEERKNKMIRSLLQKGYDYSSISSVIK